MVSIFTLTSPLHDKAAVDAATRKFLESLGIEYSFKGDDFSDYGYDLSLIFVRTGGTEGLFEELLPTLQGLSRQTILLLTSGKSNSLAASMEILSYLRQRGIQGEIIHGSSNYIARRITILSKVAQARQTLNGTRLGVIGEPSDWLISSHADKEKINERLGITLVDVPIQELIDGVKAEQEDAIYKALKTIIAKYQLQGFTLRCFDLLTAVKDTGCLPLARLNAEGYIAGCEGDIPAMLTMMISRSLLGISGFQANPSAINPETGEMLFAHCTIPLDMVVRYELDTHYESGIGTGVRGYMKEGPVTVFKVSGDLTRHFIAEGTLLRNEAKPDLCRTQQVILLKDKSLTKSYFLSNPIGNHHIILPGHHQELLENML